MEAFLSQIARHYYAEDSLGKMLFVFPSRRAAVFFRKYLCSMAAAQGRVLLAPKMETAGDFFCHLARKRADERIPLLIELYDCYRECYEQQCKGRAESLDDFVFWGDVLLSDFDDVDKFLVDAQKLFSNISELKALSVDYSDYTDEKQRAAIEQLTNLQRQFANHFDGDEQKGVKGEFRKIWDLLYPLYRSFRKRLSEKGMASSGMIYRDLAERLDKESVVDLLSISHPWTEKVVFVGLNALNSCERKVLRKFRDASLADFCWDFGGDFLADDSNPASLFRRENLAEFPQSFPLDSSRESLPRVTAVNIPSAAGQARLLPSFIDSAPESERGTDFAVVLADETLLHSVLGSLPALSGGVNVTMGYPLRSSEWYALVKDLLAAQMHLRFTDGKAFFYHKNIRDILSSSIIKGLEGEEEREAYQKILKAAKFYVPVEDFGESALLNLLFRPVVTDPSSDSQIDALSDYLLEVTTKLGACLALRPLSEEEEASGATVKGVATGQQGQQGQQAAGEEASVATVKGVATGLQGQQGQQAAGEEASEAAVKGVATGQQGQQGQQAAEEQNEQAADGTSPLQAEFALLFYRAVNSLRKVQVRMKPATWIHLLDRVVSGVSVPFEGEPLSGLQVMGPLETRSLDFKHVVILGANEGVFPKSAPPASFIPAQLRIGFGLPTYQRQDAIQAYYFYRLLTRSEDVTLCFDSRTQGLKSGEESRFIKQLRYLYRDKCDFADLIAEAEVMASDESDSIPKTQEDIDFIGNFTFSASSLHDYISCPVKFYYAHIKGLRNDDEVKESIDPSLLGTVCHDILHAIYCGDDAVLSDETYDKRNSKQPLPLSRVSRAYLKRWLTDGGKEKIRRKVCSLIKQSLHTNEITGRDLVTVEVICKFVSRVIETDLNELKRLGKDDFELLALEERMCTRLELANKDGKPVHQVKFMGYVDRIDSFEDGVIRVVDYKSGSDEQAVLDPSFDAKNIFKKETERKAKAAMQFFIYDRLVAGYEPFREKLTDRGFSNPQVKNAMYSMKDVFTDGVQTYPQDEGKNSAIMEGLESLFTEMKDGQIPFSRVERSSKNCEWCDFKLICGRNRK